MRPARNPPLLTTSPVAESWPVLVFLEYVNTADCAPITTYMRSPAELIANPVGPPGRVPVENGEPGSGFTVPLVIENPKMPPLSWSAV